jgi:hypothetical protein
VLLEQRRGDRGDISANRTRRDVRTQLAVTEAGPAPGLDGVDHILFAGALDRAHVRGPLSSAASLCLARNSNSLMLPGFRPSDAAISWCEDPCA